MQKGILIKDGSLILQKSVYGGAIDTNTMNAEITRLQTKYPTYTFTLYETDTDTAFVNAIVDTPTEVW